MPKVSVVVPVYNIESHIKNTVKSIQLQTLKEIEIILVDDGSTDESGKICDELGKEDNRIRVVHQKNQGVSVARNVGMDLATGDFIGFSDADDLMETDMYETLYQNAIKNDADLSMISPVIVTLKGNKKMCYNTKKKYTWNSEQALKSFFYGKMFDIAVYTKLLRKDLAKKVRFEKGKAIHEDKFFVYQAIENSKKIYFEDTCKYIYIKREGSASTSKFSEKKFDAVYFANKIVEEVEQKGYKEEIKKLAYVDNYMTKLQILRGIYRNRDALRDFKREKEDLETEIKGIKLKDYKNIFPKQKKIEIFVIKKLPIFYKIMVRIYDMIFTK